MSKFPKVSLIIPVYNRALYLADLFECIEAQTLDSFEVIFVDDGSTDNSLERIQSWADKRDNVQVLRQENSGAGVARNTGMAVARGDYIAFADSDDTFDPDFLRLPYLHAVNTDADIVIFDYRVVAEGKKDRIVVPATSFISLVTTHTTVSWRDLPESICEISSPSIWNKMWKRSFLEREQIDFPSLRIAQDRVFTRHALAIASAISYVSQVLYTYNMGSVNSVTSARKYAHLLASVQAANATLERVKELEHYQEIRLSVARSLVDSLFTTVNLFEGDWHSEQGMEFLSQVHSVFNSSFFAGMDKERFRFAIYGLFFEAFRENTPETLVAMLSCPIAVETGIKFSGNLYAVIMSLVKSHPDSHLILATSKDVLRPMHSWYLIFDALLAPQAVLVSFKKNIYMVPAPKVRMLLQDSVKGEKLREALRAQLSAIDVELEGISFTVEESTFVWSAPKQVCVEIPVSERMSACRTVLRIEPGTAYRVVLTMEGGNASGFEVRLWDSQKKQESHRRHVQRDEKIELVFVALPHSGEIKLFAYPEAIGKTAGHSAVIRAEIQTASVFQEDVA